MRFMSTIMTACQIGHGADNVTYRTRPSSAIIGCSAANDPHTETPSRSPFHWHHCIRPENRLSDRSGGIGLR